MGDFLKSIGGKIATAALSLAVVGAALAWFETDPATKHQILADTGRFVGWIILILTVPWTGFAVVGWVNRLQKNAAGAALVLLITLVEAFLLGWLFGFGVHGPTQWVMYSAAVLIAGVYNLFVCDLIAEKIE